METNPEFLEQWKSRMELFAKAVGKDPEEIAKLLEPMVGEPGEEALAILDEANAVSDAELKEAFKPLSIPSGKLNMHLAKLRAVPEAKEEAASAAGSSVPAFSILPTVPDETSFLEMLKTGGVLKVGETEVLSAVKAGLANQFNVYELPSIILQKMEEFADKQEEPVGETYYDMQKLVTEKKYGDVLSVFKLTGSYMSEAKKKAFFAKLNERLWRSLSQFQDALKAWQEAWTTGMNPGMMMMAMASHASGTTLPSGMVDPPDTMPIHASAEEVINDINRIFAGVGIPVARALAYDATRIMKILNEPGLPAQLGAVNKDQMIKDLGLRVGADIVRTEQSLTRYTLAVMMLEKVPAEQEMNDLVEMSRLGSTIPWEKLTGKLSGIGATKL